MKGAGALLPELRAAFSYIQVATYGEHKRIRGACNASGPSYEIEPVYRNGLEFNLTAGLIFIQFTIGVGCRE